MVVGKVVDEVANALEDLVVAECGESLHAVTDRSLRLGDGRLHAIRGGWEHVAHTSADAERGAHNIGRVLGVKAVNHL